MPGGWRGSWARARAHRLSPASTCDAPQPRPPPRRRGAGRGSKRAGRAPGLHSGGSPRAASCSGMPGARRLCASAPCLGSSHRRRPLPSWPRRPRPASLRIQAFFSPARAGTCPPTAILGGSLYAAGALAGPPLPLPPMQAGPFLPRRFPALAFSMRAGALCYSP